MKLKLYLTTAAIFISIFSGYGAPTFSSVGAGAPEMRPNGTNGMPQPTVVAVVAPNVAAAGSSVAPSGTLMQTAAGPVVKIPAAGAGVSTQEMPAAVPSAGTMGQIPGHMIFDHKAAQLKAALREESKPQDVIKDVAGMAALDNELNSAFFQNVFVSKTIALNANNIPIRSLIDMIGRSIGVTFFIDQSVEGVISNLRTPHVEVGQILQLICRQARPEAALVRTGDLWQVTTKRNAYQMVKDVRSKGVVYKVFPINYANVDGDFKRRVEDGWKNIVKDEASAYLYIDAEQKRIYIKADNDSTNEFAQYLKEIDRPVLQVRIDVVIVLAKKDFFFDFGIDWSGIYNREQSLRACHPTFGFYGLGGGLLDFPNPASVTSQTSATPNPVVPNPPNSHNPNLFVDPLNFALNLFNSGAAFLTDNIKDRNIAGLIRIPFVFGGTDLSLRRLNLVLNMAEIEEKINIVSRPSILTSNNKVAKILIGQSIPLQTTLEDLTTTDTKTTRLLTTINYKDTGIVLEVKPLVSPDKKSVFLDVLVEDSLVESGNTQVNDKGVMINPPTISVIKTKNEIVLKNGQTTIIGGLSQKINSATKRSVPLLSDIPIIGNLFKATIDANQERERFIFITPTIVEYEV